MHTKERECFFYQKNRNKFVPVEGIEVNKFAKIRLDQIFKKAADYDIPQRFLEQWDDVVLYNAKGNIEKANALFFIPLNSAYDLSNSLNDLTAKEWLPETVTVFSQKGLGAGNKEARIERMHPAPYSFQDVARHIRFFTKRGEKVLDPFVGVGSTLKACCFEDRIGYGIELNPKYADLSKQRIETEVPDKLEFKNAQTIINGNCLDEITHFGDDFFDFIITSPPYWNILDTKDHKALERESLKLDTKYSDSNLDLSNIDTYEDFIRVLGDFFCSCSRVLKTKKYLAVVVSDFRKLDRYYIFHADLARYIEENSPFKIKGIKILYQRHKSIFPYGYPFSFVPNVHHQNVLILQNTK